jgi:hypothetical protein
VTEPALWARRQQAGSSRRLGYLDGVLSAAEMVPAGDPGTADLLALLTTELTALLGLDGCRYALVAPHLRVQVQLNGQAAAASGQSRSNGPGCPPKRRSCCGVRNSGETVGRFVLPTASRVRRPTPEQL